MTRKTKNFEYTKGIWYAVGAWVEHEDDEIPDICSCNPCDFGQGHLKRDYGEICANTKLIASAPSMLLALIDCVECLESFINCNEGNDMSEQYEILRFKTDYVISGSKKIIDSATKKYSPNNTKHDCND